MKDKIEIIDKICKLRHGGMDDKQFKAAIEHLLTGELEEEWPCLILAKKGQMCNHNGCIVEPAPQEMLGEACYSLKDVLYANERGFKTGRDEALAEGRTCCKWDMGSDGNKYHKPDCPLVAAPQRGCCGECKANLHPDLRHCGNDSCHCHHPNKPKLPEKIGSQLKGMHNHEQLEILAEKYDELLVYLAAKEG